MTIHSFEIISVPVSDPQRAKAFYRDILGFALIREEPMGPGMTWIQLAPQGQSVTIALVTWFEQMKPGGLQGVMVNTENIDAEHKCCEVAVWRLARSSRSPGAATPCSTIRMEMAGYCESRRLANIRAAGTELSPFIHP